ncbi:MAG: alpha/beta fold hydrolase [Beijerinckiaceae bacterium]|nr:alpha/beta fold hydrolase [Beijerinckiaceae bacterium]
MRPLTTSAALPSAARNILVLYHSRGLNGEDVAVSGAISVPRGAPPAGGWPVITWTHGTTGLVAACAPSRDTPKGPEHVSLSQKQALLDTYVKRGYAVVATDYQGLGGPGLHPFLQGVIAGHNAIDIIRAARQADQVIGTRYVVMGHSQGGHANLFAAALGPKYAPELNLLGNVAFAPASHIDETLTSMLLATSPSLRLGYSMYVLQSFASNHPTINLSRLLSQSAMENLPLTQEQCVTATLSSGYWATAVPQQQFLKDPELSGVLKVAVSNDPGALQIEAPTFIAQGSADETVLPSWTDDVAQRLCENGTPIEYAVYAGADHETVVDQAAAKAQRWIDARFAGQEAINSCWQLPRARQ